MFGWLKKYSPPSALKANGVLGMNARNYNIISRLNDRRLYPLVDDKVKTKVLAGKAGINTPRLIGVIEYQHQVKDFIKIVEGCPQFVIKPAHGSGGKGVLVINRWEGQRFFTASGKELGFQDVFRHISNTLSGLFSLGGQYDVAVIEEMVNFSDMFKNFSYQGVPDVRIIVYKGYPAMSMMRLATAESGGRANLHQGAVGVGLDIQSGKTLQAVMHNLPVSVHPDTKADLKSLVVPFWREHLLIGAKAYEMTGLGYLGADIVLDKNRGPMMLELNARPGLAIQIANGHGLMSVIKKIEKTYPTGLTPEERVDYILNAAP
ncbi:putative alpha-L-glutamate ligase family protein [Acetobacter sp. CAG:977]|nr:putative alpha-L-glutamate ligase family protein [Acetobacter sp. CAG:977]